MFIAGGLRLDAREKPLRNTLEQPPETNFKVYLVRKDDTFIVCIRKLLETPKSSRPLFCYYIHCEWEFSSGDVEMNGKMLALMKRISNAQCLYVDEQYLFQNNSLLSGCHCLPSMCNHRWLVVMATLGLVPRRLSSRKAWRCS